MMRDLRVIAAWVFSESNLLGGILREPELWAALVGGLLLWALAYQLPYSYQLDVGGNQRTGRQHDDAPFLTNFNAPEPDGFDDHPEAVPFRWTKADSTITLPGIGGGYWNTTVRAASGRSDGSPIRSRWDDRTTPWTVTVDGRQRLYQLAVAADGAGDLTLHLLTPPRAAPGDPRSLGLVLFRVSVDSTGARWPAARQLGLLTAALALAYALLRRLVLPPRPALAYALGLAALAASLLARERMALTLLAPGLPAILGGCYALAIVLDAIVHLRLVRPADANAGAPRLRREPARRASFIAHRSSHIVGLVVLALALRLGGLLHPHARFSDIGLNRHNLASVIRGELYFTEGLPSDAGGGRAPYPPGQYVVLAPAQLVLAADDESLNLLLKVGNALWDSLAVGLLWYVLRRGGYGPRVALLGAALYVLPPPMLKSLSVGELANVFGQGLALPLLALLALQARRLDSPPTLAAVVALLGLALLGHLGVTISLFCLLGYLGLVWLIRPETRRAVRALIGAGLLAGGLIALVYYTAFWDVLRARLGAAGPIDRSAALPGVAEQLHNQLQALPAYGVHPLALASGAIGVALVALRRRRIGPDPPPALGTLLIAWWGGTLLSLGLLLFANQGVRWQQFLFPALCLGAAPTLSALWPRGRAGRNVAGALLAFLLWYGLAFWVAQIRDYLH